MSTTWGIWNAAELVAVASRLIKDALSAKVIRPHDEDASRKYMKYVPAWA